MQRRELLKMGAGALLTAGLWPGRARAEDNGQGESDWSFIAVNDLHFDAEACGPWFEKVVAAMKLSAPDAEFCLLGGDLSDDAQAEQFDGARTAFQGLGIPLYATPGNHDYATNEDRTTYDQRFPGQTNQVFEHRDWQIIGLDTSDGMRYANTHIQPATFAWLSETLPKLSHTKPTVIWTHFPLGAGVTNRPLDADTLLDQFVDFNIQATYSGHWHGFSEKSWQHAVLTTDRCCSRVRDNHDGSPLKGWFVCTAKDGKIERRFVEIPAM